jgi:hypothetical protein
MRRLRRRFAIGLALWAGLALIRVEAASPDEVPRLFGQRVEANSRFPVPFATGDFDGDGTADALYLVTVLPQSPGRRIAADVTVIGRLFGSEALGLHGEGLALAILQDHGKRKFLLTGYHGDAVTDYFGSPIWSEMPVPLSIATRGSQPFEKFRQQGAKIEHDILVVGTEAGIDTALYWTGKTYALFQPAEEP